MRAIKGLAIFLGVFFGISILGWAQAMIVNVPAPNHVDDTAVVQAALDQCVTYCPGCTVQLAAGTYLTKQLFAKDFYGTFKGKGMDVTIIQALPNLPVSQEQLVWNTRPSKDNPYPMLVLFFGGDVTVSDMTIRALEPNPVEGWYSGELATPTTLMWGILEFMGESKMNVVVNRVALEGVHDESQPDYDHYNATGLSIDPYPPFVGSSPGYLSGAFRVSACRFDTLLEGIFVAVLHEAQFTIGGSPSEANLIQNCDIGTVLIDLDSSSVDFSYNDVSVVGPGANAGFAAFQGAVGPIEAPSSFLVQRNHIKVKGSYEDGVWIVDYGPVSGVGKKGDFVISDNTFILSPGELPTYAGVEAVFLDGAVISNNRILGSSTLGIALEGAFQCMVKGNNVEKITTDLAPIGLLTLNIGTVEEPIFLPTSDSTVVGFGKKTNVYDEGVNNTIVGVNNMNGNPPGPAIRDAMKRKMEIIKSIRKP